MAIRYGTIILAAALLATVVALSVSVLEPKKAEAAPVTTCDGTTLELTPSEQRIVDLHNWTRTSRGLSPLCVDPILTTAARAHSAALLQSGSFGHGPVGARLRSYGYSWRTFGENIAGGSGSFGHPDNIFKRWMKSPPHRANILNGRFREIGVGAATGTYRGFRNYTMYTVDFATPR